MNASTLLVALLPEHLLLAGIVLLIVLDIVGRAERPALSIALGAVLAAAVAAAALAFSGYQAEPFPYELAVDRPASIAKAFVLALALPVLLLARDEASGRPFHVLVLSSLYGACLIASSQSFLTLFLAIELMSLPVYVLVLLAWRRPESAEAALKYLVLGGAASATLLMGAALLFGGSGTLALSTFSHALGSRDPMSSAGLALVTAALFIKAAIVPFHAWAPDAYEGASVPVTAYMATIVKAGVLLAALRLFNAVPVERPLVDLLALLPLVSIAWGNLAAMRQPTFRRMIAYSSIAHAGYLFFALLGEGSGRYEAVVFYLVTYGLMNLLAFAALPRGVDGDGWEDRLDALKGLFSRRPYAAVTLAIAMLSLAGIPPLPGFVAKFLVFRNVMDAGYTLYGVLGLVASYLGIYFYLRVIQLMFMSPVGEAQALGQERRMALVASLACLVPTIAIAVYPDLVLRLL